MPAKSSQDELPEGTPYFDSDAALSPNARAWAAFRANRAAFAGCWMLLLIIIVTLLAPCFLPLSPNVLSETQYAPPSTVHWCGTDAHGRDLLSRILYGSRISMMVGLVGALVSLAIGATWGTVAGYCGGRWDSLLMRIVDILYSLPSIIFVIVVLTTLESLLVNLLQSDGQGEQMASVRLVLLFCGLGAVSWLNMARMVRGQVMSLRNRTFVLASQALGASTPRILFNHILPNVSGIIITYLTLTVPSIVLYESFLSFLGLGIQPPHASLGSLIAEGAMQLNPLRIYWWMLVFPAGTLATTLLALNFVGDGLRDAFDPRSQKP